MRGCILSPGTKPGGTELPRMSPRPTEVEAENGELSEERRYEPIVSAK